MIGVFCGGLIFGIAVGFVFMVFYMMKDVYYLSIVVIGSGIMFFGMMSVIIFGYIGGWFVDWKGFLYVLIIGIVLMFFSFLIVVFFIDVIFWFMIVIIVFVFGGFFFIKMVIFIIVFGSLK